MLPPPPPPDDDDDDDDDDDEIARMPFLPSPSHMCPHRYLADPSSTLLAGECRNSHRGSTDLRMPDARLYRFDAWRGR